MNRLQRLASVPVSTRPVAPRLDRTRPPGPPSGSPFCTTFVPHHYEPNYAYPLLVWLHGPGDDERQLRRIIPYVSLQNYVAVCPRGCSPPLPDEVGYRWSQTAAAIDAAEQRVFEAIDAVSERYRIRNEHVFLVGFQCGGTMALRLALRHPARFAGVASLGGAFPEGAAPLARLRHLRRLPILIAQGRDSLEYPLRQGCDELRLFHAASLHVSIRQYPVADDLTTVMLADLNTWMMEQITGVSQEPNEDRFGAPDSRN